MSKNLLLTRDGAVATLTLNRPDALNVLDLAMMDALVAHTAALAVDSTVRVVVLRGAGKHFMAGGDLRTFAAQLSEIPPARRQTEFQRIVDRLKVAPAEKMEDAEIRDHVCKVLTEEPALEHGRLVEEADIPTAVGTFVSQRAGSLPMK